MDSNATGSAVDNDSLMDHHETNVAANPQTSQRAPQRSHDVEKPSLPAELIRQIAAVSVI